jgi:recombinational DNA repair ATPase RecF
MMETSKSTERRSRARITPRAYFLSLTVENVRCFGPAQTLDLSDGRGHHTPWTVILGENDLGKTTLLSCIAAISGRRRHLDETSDFLGLKSDRGDFVRGSGDLEGRMKAVLTFTDGSRRDVKLDYAKEG